MIKTGYEIIGMIKDGKAPKKIKNSKSFIYEFAPTIKTYYIDGDVCLDLIQCLNDEFEIIEENDGYFYLESNGYIAELKNKDIFGERSQILLNKRYEMGNCFKTAEEAQKALEKLKVYVKLKRYAEEHNTEKIDWDNPKQSKFHIEVFNDDNNKKKIHIWESNRVKHMNQVYFTSEELCKQAIKEIGKDNIKKLFEE